MTLGVADHPLVPVLSVLILGRLMRYDSIVRRYCTAAPGPTVHRKVARTIAQSEAVYSAAIVAQLVLYLTHSTKFLVSGYIFPPLVVRPARDGWGAAWCLC